MKCGPDECPIAAFSDLTPAEQRVQRQRIARKMSDQGFTEQQIAKQLRVSQATISGDLSNLSVSDKLNPAKTASNPKGAGRPKGSGGRMGTAEPRNKTVAPEDRPKIARAVLDRGKTVEQAAEEAGVSIQIVKTEVAKEQGRREAEPIVTPEMLSMTQQHKNDVWRRREMQKMQASYEARVEETIRRRLDEIILPIWKKQIEEAKTLFERRRGLMTKDTFNIIRRALHPDSRNSISDKKLCEAFDSFMGLEKYLLNEKDSPTLFEYPNGAGLPADLAGWDRMKAAATAARKKARQQNGNAVRPRA